MAEQQSNSWCFMIDCKSTSRIFGDIKDILIFNKIYVCIAIDDVCIAGLQFTKESMRDDFWSFIDTLRFGTRY